MKETGFRAAALFGAVVGMVALGCGPATAQKAKDTLRLAFSFPISTVDAYQDFKPEAEMTSRMVFDGLVAYDELQNKFEPLLAESWERINPTTYRFKLRRGVKWHDGQIFDADDVVYTISWITDPKTRLRAKGLWRWLKGAKKIDAYTVDIIGKAPTPAFLPTLSTVIHILPEHAHGPLKRKQDFRKNLIGTGMYKVASLSDRGLLVLEKNKDYKHGGTVKPAGSISKVVIRSIKDTGAQTAALLGGKLDVVRNISFEEARALARNPNYSMTISQSIAYMYMMLDTIGKGGAKALKDPRVRQALMMAVDRKALQGIRTGGKLAPRQPDHLCWKFQTSCSFSVALPKYDPEGAKKLLAAAGYGDGLSLTIHTFGSTRDFGEVVSGFLRKVGVRTSVTAQTFAAYRKSQANGEFQILVGAWNAGGGPDAGLSVRLFFTGGVRDLLKDEKLIGLSRKIMSVEPGKEREEMIATILDTSVQKFYMIPLAGIPVVFLHSSDVKINPNRNLAYTVTLADFSWK